MAKITPEEAAANRNFDKGMSSEEKKQMQDAYKSAQTRQAGASTQAEKTAAKLDLLKQEDALREKFANRVQDAYTTKTKNRSAGRASSMDLEGGMRPGQSPSLDNPIKMAKGGMTASKRADGCATKGKTKGRFV